MKPRINIITVAVDNLERSLAFYRDGLGWPTEGIVDDADHVAFELKNGLFFVLYPRTTLAADAGQPNAAPSSVEFVLSHFVPNREDVDALLKHVESIGGTPLESMVDQPWGYSRQFKDPDGHIWEIMWHPGFEMED